MDMWASLYRWSHAFLSFPENVLFEISIQPGHCHLIMYFSLFSPPGGTVVFLICCPISLYPQSRPPLPIIVTMDTLPLSNRCCQTELLKWQMMIVWLQQSQWWAERFLPHCSTQKHQTAERERGVTLHAPLWLHQRPLILLENSLPSDLLIERDTIAACFQITLLHGQVFKG